MNCAAQLTLGAIRSTVEALEQPQSVARIVAAAAIIETRQSRVIVTGMGKCSHVGRKIAATLMSTGQPAAFLHPGEAAHGDMGMIMDGDVILALSNSGETDEVLGVVQFALDHGCKVLVITSKPASRLAQLASVMLLIPAGPEGCPIGRAPMASAAAMMATGDALAAELMARHGFTEQDFLALHHGGYLGRAIRQSA